MKTSNILLVEDRAADVRLTKRALKKTGYSLEIEVASNGREALDRLLDSSKRAPDLILLDWMMPMVDGCEVLVEMQKSINLRKIPVIVLTTSKSERDIELAYQEGCNAYLTKPVDPVEFQQTIETMSLFWLEKALLPSSRK